MPLHFYSRLIGLTSFSIHRKKGKIVAKVSFYNFVSILCSTLCCLISSVYFIDFYNDLSEYLDMFKSSDVFKSSISFVGFSYLYITFLTNWGTFCNKKSSAFIFDSFQDVDERLEAFKIKINFPKQEKFFWQILFVIFLIVLANIFLTYFFLVEQLKLTFCFSLIVVWMYFVAMVLCFIQYSCLTWSVKFRYIKINKYLNDKYLSKYGPKITDRRFDSNRENTRQTRRYC